jgi:hypothetical protein
MRLLSFVLACALLSGCMTGSSMVVRPGGQSNSQYAPLNEKSRFGTVKYLNDGYRFVKEARRENAYKQMHDSCGGDYRIINEGTQSEGSVIMPVNQGAVALSSQYLYIQYECVR